MPGETRSGTFEIWRWDRQKYLSSVYGVRHERLKLPTLVVIETRDTRVSIESFALQL